MLKVGAPYPTWFSAQPDGMSTILAITRYVGKYPEHFNYVLRLSAPRTRRGWIEMAIKVGNMT